MKKIFFILGILLCLNICAETKTKIIAIRNTKGLYYENIFMGINVELTNFRGDGEIGSIYISKNYQDYLKILFKGTNELRIKMKDIFKKYESCENLNDKDREEREAHMENEIENLFKGILHELEVSYNKINKKFYFGYENLRMYLLNENGEKLYDSQILEFLSNIFSEGVKDLMYLWMCDKKEDSYFHWENKDEDKCSKYHYVDEYYSCDAAEKKIGIECVIVQKNENEKYFVKDSNETIYEK